jgi:hypothetical protein
MSDRGAFLGPGVCAAGIAFTGCEVLGLGQDRARARTRPASLRLEPHPDRFVAFASVALQYPDLAVQQLVDAVKRLGLRGAAVGASVAGEEFANPKFHPFWAKAEELGILIFIHPQSTPDLARRFQGNGSSGRMADDKQRCRLSGARPANAPDSRT